MVGTLYFLGFLAGCFASHSLRRFSASTSKSFRSDLTKLSVGTDSIESFSRLFGVAI
jgi:hypothetical protein